MYGITVTGMIKSSLLPLSRQPVLSSVKRRGFDSLLCCRWRHSPTDRRCSASVRCFAGLHASLVVSQSNHLVPILADRKYFTSATAIMHSAVQESLESQFSVDLLANCCFLQSGGFTFFVLQSYELLHFPILCYFSFQFQSMITVLFGCRTVRCLKPIYKSFSFSIL